MDLLHARIGICELSPHELDTWPRSQVLPIPEGLMSSIQNPKYGEVRSISSTCYVVYAKDVADGSINQIVMEPYLFRDGPCLLQDMPVVGNMYKSTIEDAETNKIVFHSSRFDMPKDILLWSPQDKRDIVDFLQTRLVDRMTENQQKLGLESMTDSDWYYYVMIGENLQGRHCGLAIASTRASLGVSEDSPYLDQYKAQPGARILGLPSLPFMSVAICMTCNQESELLAYNERDEQGNYVPNVVQCQSCGDKARWIMDA